MAIWETSLIQIVIFFWFQRLSAIAQSTFRVVVNLDHQSVSSGATEAFAMDLPATISAGMAWVYDDRKMSQTAQDRNALEVQRVPGIGFKGADSALA